MFQQILLSVLMILATTAVHAGCTMAVVAFYRKLNAATSFKRSHSAKVGVLSAFVVLFFLASLFEIWLWAWMYLAVGALSDLERAFYFSTVTFTTLGYGDVVLHSSWRLLASFEGANGVIMFGWTTAVIVALMHRILVHAEPTGETGN